ncbi:MAG: class I SAM-dependent methyltransferase [Actinomycetota bacterium]
MIWNDQVLCLHPPRTAGRSVKSFFADNMPGSIHVQDFASLGASNRLRYRQGNPHLDLTQAASVLASSGRGLESFDLIISVMRDPFDAEISLFDHIRGGADWPHERTRDLASDGDLGAYLDGAGIVADGSPRLDRFYEFDGGTLPNLRVVPFADVATAVPALLEPFARRPRLSLFPHLNRGDGRDAATVLDDATEAKVMQRHRWFFDRGYARPLAARASSTTTTSATRPTQGGPTMADPALQRRPFRVPRSVRRALSRGDETPSVTPVHQYLLAVLDRTSFDGARVLGIGATLDLAEPMFDGRLPTGSYVGIESSDALVDAIQAHDSDVPVQMFAADAAEVLTADAPLFRSLGPFDVIIVRRAFQTMNEDQVRSALTTLRAMVSDNGVVVFDCNVSETSLSGLGSMDIMARNAVREHDLSDLPPYSELEPFPGFALAFYRSFHILAIARECGWDPRQFLEPRPSFQHHVIATPDEDEATG